MAILGTKTEEKKEKKAAESSADSSAFTLTVPTILIQPRISEKAGELAKLNKYVFKVLRNIPWII